MHQKLVRSIAFLVALTLSSVTAWGQSIQVFGDDPQLTHLGKEVERLAQAAKGRVGVAVYHLETDRGFTLNGREAFPMASTYKVPIAVEILSRVDAGKMSLQDLVTIEQKDLRHTASMIADLLDTPGARLTIENLLGMMLRISDNIATDLLFRAAGGAEVITARMQAVGATGIRVDRPTWVLIANWLGSDVTLANPISPDEYNALLAPESLGKLKPADFERLNHRFNQDPRDTATPEAMSMLLRKIWRREILSESSSGLLLDIMWRCDTGERRLKGLLPPDTEVAHKTGTIGETTNDVGIIRLPDGAGHVICVVYIKESKLENNAAMEPVIAQIARAVHDYFVFNRG